LMEIVSTIYVVKIYEFFITQNELIFLISSNIEKFFN